jgi:hypothetical protein
MNERSLAWRRRTQRGFAPRLRGRSRWSRTMLLAVWPFQSFQICSVGLSSGGIRRELLQMEPWVGLAYRLDGRPSMNGTAVPAEDDMAAQRPQQRTEEVCHIYGLELCGWKRTGKPRCWRFGDTVSAASAEIRPCLSG